MVTTPSAMTGTTHDVVNPATTVSLVVKVSGMMPTTPSSGDRGRADDQAAGGQRDRSSARLPSAVTSSDIMK